MSSDDDFTSMSAGVSGSELLPPLNLVDGHCSFCGERGTNVCGPCVYICETCAKLACEIFAEHETAARTLRLPCRERAADGARAEEAAGERVTAVRHVRTLRMVFGTAEQDLPEHWGTSPRMTAPQTSSVRHGLWMHNDLGSEEADMVVRCQVHLLYQPGHHPMVRLQAGDLPAVTISGCGVGGEMRLSPRQGGNVIIEGPESIVGKVIVDLSFTGVPRGML